MCVCVSSFLNHHALYYAIRSSHQHEEAAKIASTLCNRIQELSWRWSGRAKEIIIAEKFSETSSAICPTELQMLNTNGMIMELMNTYRRFRFIFCNEQKSWLQINRRYDHKWKEKEENLPCLRRTWPPNNAIRTILNNNTAKKNQKWKLSNSVNNNVKKWASICLTYRKNHFKPAPDENSVDFDHLFILVTRGVTLDQC